MFVNHIFVKVIVFRLLKKNPHDSTIKTTALKIVKICA